MVSTIRQIINKTFGFSTLEGDQSGYEIDVKFGRNSNIDPLSDPEDMWNGGGLYTGFNATTNENLRLLSSSASDTGSLVDSGTATGGTSTTLIDSGANFIVDGVVAGQCLINDTKSAHGIITSVTATTITVFSMVDSDTSTINNESGDSYRVASATGTGTAVVRSEAILDSDYIEQPPVYTILNGTTPVITSCNAMRTPRHSSIISGSNGTNVGEITVTQETSTSNVFAVMPITGQSTIGVSTVPSGKRRIIKGFNAAIVRQSGAAGSATINFNIRPFGQSWRAIRTFEVSTSQSVNEKDEGGIILHSGTDMKFTIQTVSDNGTVAEGEFEYYDKSI